MSEITEPINWHDDSYCSSDRVVLTEANLQIPGLRTFGWHDMKRAIPALLPHFHENCYEIVFVTKGSITFSTGQRDYALYGGDVFLTGPGEIHSTNGVPMSVGEICWMQLDVSSLDDFLFLNRGAAAHLVAMISRTPHHCIRTDTNKAKHTLKELNGILLHTSQRDPFLTAGYIVTYLYQLFSQAATSEMRVSFDIARACEYISDHIQEELPFEEIAAFCHISVSQFKQKFKSQMGVSPRSYINQQKVEQIKKDLTDGANFTQIAADFSFCNPAYFSVVFKKYTNQSPSEYLQSLRHPARPAPPADPHTD